MYLKLKKISLEGVGQQHWNLENENVEICILDVGENFIGELL